MLRYRLRPGLDVAKINEQAQAVEYIVRTASTELERARAEDLVLQFNRAWSMPVTPPRSGAQSEFEITCDALQKGLLAELQSARARIRERAELELDARLARARGRWHERARIALADMRALAIREQSQTLEEFYVEGTRLLRHVRQQTRSLERSMFEDIEGPYLDSQIQCWATESAEDRDQYYRQAEARISETTSKAVVDVMKRIATPREMFAKLMHGAERDLSERVARGRNEIDALGVAFEETLTNERESLLAEVLGKATAAKANETVADVLRERRRLSDALESAALRIAQQTDDVHLSALQDGVAQVRRDLAAIRRHAIRGLAKENGVFDEAVTDICTAAAKARSDLGDGAKDHFTSLRTKLSYVDPDLQRDWLRSPFDPLPTISVATELGYQIGKELRVNFAEKWRRQRPEDIDREYQALLIWWRLTQSIAHDNAPRGPLDPKLGSDALASSIESFNFVWSRARFDDDAHDRLTRTLRSRLDDLAPLIRELAPIELDSVMLRGQRVWRSGYSLRVADLRRMVSTRATEQLHGSDSDREHTRIAADRAADAVRTNLVTLGELERAYHEATAFATPDRRNELERVRASTIAMVESAVESAQERLRSAAEKQLSAQQSDREQLCDQLAQVLRDCLGELDRIDREQRQAFTASRERYRQELGLLLEPSASRTSLFPPVDRFSKIGALLLQVDRYSFKDNEARRRELAARFAELKHRIESVGAASTSPSTERLLNEIDGIATGLSVDCQHYVDRAIRRFQRAR